MMRNTFFKDVYILFSINIYINIDKKCITVNVSNIKFNGNYDYLLYVYNYFT